MLEAAKALDKKITGLQSSLYNTDIQPFGQDNIHYLQRFHDNLQGLMRDVMQSYGEAPKSQTMEEAVELRKELDTHLKEINDLLANDVAAFNKTATEHGASTLFAGPPVQIKADSGGESGAGDEMEEQD
jgi:phosphoglycerate-specific signal transduction histidine kinase